MVRWSDGEHWLTAVDRNSFATTIRAGVPQRVTLLISGSGYLASPAGIRRGVASRWLHLAGGCCDKSTEFAEAARIWDCALGCLFRICIDALRNHRPPRLYSPDEGIAVRQVDLTIRRNAGAASPTPRGAPAIASNETADILHYGTIGLGRHSSARAGDERSDLLALGIDSRDTLADSRFGQLNTPVERSRPRRVSPNHHERRSKFDFQCVVARSQGRLSAAYSGGRPVTAECIAGAGDDGGALS